MTIKKDEQNNSNSGSDTSGLVSDAFSADSSSLKNSDSSIQSNGAKFRSRILAPLLYFGLWLLGCGFIYAVKYLLLEKYYGVSLFNIFSVYEMHNKGAAFSILSNNREFIIICSVIALCILSLAVISSKISIKNSAAMGFLSAGIFMNMFERIHYGFVTDYFYFNLIPSLPVFNMADVFIVLSVSVLILSILRKK